MLRGRGKCGCGFYADPAALTAKTTLLFHSHHSQPHVQLQQEGVFSKKKKKALTNQLCSTCPAPSGRQAKLPTR